MGEKEITSSTLGKYSFDSGVSQLERHAKGVQLQIRPVGDQQPHD